MILINGVALAWQPQNVISSYNFLAADTSGRNTMGDMLIDRVAVKVKLELKWGGLAEEEVSSILQAIEPVFFDVTYNDPKTQLIKTITCYSGDPVTEVLFKMPDGRYFYRSLSVNLIQQ